MSNFAEKRFKSVLENRKIYENLINSCQQWYSEVEVIMSADVRLSSLTIVKDQLQKVIFILISTLLSKSIYNILYISIYSMMISITDVLKLTM